MRRNAIWMMVLGVIGGICIWSCLGCIALVRDAFDVSAFMGWSTLVCIGLLFGGFVYLGFAELSGYFSIRKVDALAKALQGNDVEIARRLTASWLQSITEQETSSLQNIETVQELRDAITQQLLPIDAAVDRTIAKESIVIAAFVGISPWPMFDGAIVGWRQLRMMRSISVQYGVRPSTLGTLRLLRRVLISVVLADVSEHATQWIASKVPSMGGLIPSAGQSLAVLVLTARVGKACKVACRPMDKNKTRMRRTCMSTFIGLCRKKPQGRRRDTPCGLDAPKNPIPEVAP
jgi:putative membrane protein